MVRAATTATQTQQHQQQWGRQEQMLLLCPVSDLYLTVDSHAMSKILETTADTTPCRLSEKCSCGCGEHPIQAHWRSSIRHIRFYSEAMLGHKTKSWKPTAASLLCRPMLVRPQVGIIVDTIPCSGNLEPNRVL